MNSKDSQERFYDTMLELANQLKFNAETIQSQNIMSIINLILEAYNKKNIIFVYGAGRSGFIGRCFAQRLMHLNIKSCFISDAVTHQYTSNDILILVSGSGETTSTRAIAEKAKQIGGKLIAFSGNPESAIGKLSDYVIEIKGKSKDNALILKSLAPYTSLFDISALAVLDSIGGILMKKLGVTEEDINKRHASIE